MACVLCCWWWWRCWCCCRCCCSCCCLGLWLGYHNLSSLLSGSFNRLLDCCYDFWVLNWLDNICLRLFTDWWHNFRILCLLLFWRLLSRYSGTILSGFIILEALIALHAPIARHIPVRVVSFTLNTPLSRGKRCLDWTDSDISTGSQCKEFKS